MNQITIPGETKILDKKPTPFLNLFKSLGVTLWIIFKFLIKFFLLMFLNSLVIAIIFKFTHETMNSSGLVMGLTLTEMYVLYKRKQPPKYPEGTIFDHGKPILPKEQDGV